MSVDSAGSSLSTAINTNITNSTNTFTDLVGRSHKNDYYQFSLSSRSSFNLLLNDLSPNSNVNVQLLKDNTSVIGSSANHNRSAESINMTIEAGIYDIRIYWTRGSSTQYNLKVSSLEVPKQDWFDQNLHDAGIRAEAKNRFADGMLDRNDLIAILRETENNGVVNTTEIQDLDTLVNNASYLKIPDYVRVLSNKVINGDAANQQYQNNTLGNLSAGSSADQMEKLISKWFLGSDRPTTSYAYQYASGSLFQNGLNYQDVKQGEINDCFFLAGLAETALRSPSTIESMFTDNGDNTFTVRFWHNNVADYLTVDKYLPTNSAGSFVYANRGTSHNNSSNKLWVALAEKAYAQLNQSGWIYQDNTNSYNGISHGGYDSDAFAQITGQNTTFGNPLNSSSIINALNAGQLVGINTKLTDVASNVVPNHAYALIDYNASSQKFSLFNPWGIDNGSSKPGILELTESEIKTSFSYWDSTIAQSVPT